jgi:3-methylcrotonyl-CoA carboxylase alpha subunit
MLNKILIANRGEIARRIIRTARRLGIRTVAVYSDADRDALYVRDADGAVHIGPSPAVDSYLRGDRIIAAAKTTGAEAIHPGYGFLAENADFADAVATAKLIFIGPSAAAMRALGGKAAAKDIAIKAGVPVVPGYQGEKQDAASLSAEARRIGYPVMIKAVAGGGGRGMRRVDREADLPELLASAQREAQGAFGDARVLIEKVVERPRHIEVQVFGDNHGNVVQLVERDCTLQRRNQKVIEEAPAPGMSPELRQKMCAAAVSLAKAVGYSGAGTVEFLVEGGSLGPQARWYFIEMNTRLQVEHPVTEEITGLDLVEWQLRVAAGERLPLSQERITMHGHAIETRLCAEDPTKDFLPSVGRLVAFDVPERDGLRVETGVAAGSVVPPDYDSMIAKLITSAPDRAGAITAMIEALNDTDVAGLRTNARFLRSLLQHPATVSGAMDTGLIGRDLDDLTRSPSSKPVIELGVLHMLVHEREAIAAARRDRGGDWPSPWDAGDGFQLGAERRQSIRVVADGNPEDVDVWWRADGPVVPIAAAGEAVEETPISIHADGDRLLLVHDLTQVELARPAYDPASVEEDGGGTSVRAPINGKVARLFVREGDTVAKGDRIAIVEAMKMEHVLSAARDGVVARVAVSEGQQVSQGAVIAAFDAD